MYTDASLDERHEIVNSQVSSWYFNINVRSSEIYKMPKVKAVQKVAESPVFSIFRPFRDPKLQKLSICA